MCALALALGGCETLPDVLSPGADDGWDRCSHPEATSLEEQAGRAVAREDEAAAAGLYRKLVEVCPNYVSAHRAYIESARRAGPAVQKEMERFYLALTDRPRSPVVPYVKAAVVTSDQERIALLEESIARAPDSFHWGYLSLGRVLRRPDVRKSGRALEMFQRSVEVRGDCAPCNLEYAEALAEVGRIEEAEKRYRRYRELRPFDRTVTKQFIQLLVHGSFPSRRRLEEARALVDELLELDPEDSDLWMMRAAIAWESEDYRSARDHYQKVIELYQVEGGGGDIDYWRAVLNLGNLYYSVLADVDPGGKEAWWPKARDAYQHFSQQGVADGVFDLVDLYVAIPYRLQRIDEAIGPAPEGHVPEPLKTF